MNTFNFDDGFPEAVVRALSKSFITKEKYDEFIQASDLNEFKVLLEDTDYSEYMKKIDDAKIDPIDIKRAMFEKLRDEIEYMMG